MHSHRLLAAVKDGNKYSDIDQRSMKYVRDNYKGTDEADTWRRNEINKWNLKGLKDRNRRHVFSFESIGSLAR